MSAPEQGGHFCLRDGLSFRQPEKAGVKLRQKEQREIWWVRGEERKKEENKVTRAI
jgi:hypothetical protein